MKYYSPVGITTTLAYVVYQSVFPCGKTKNHALNGRPAREMASKKGLELGIGEFQCDMHNCTRAARNSNHNGVRSRPNGRELTESLKKLDN